MDKNIEANTPWWWLKTMIERITVDTVVHRGPALVFGLTIASDGGGEADAKVYDGFNTGGRVKHDLYCADEEMYHAPFNPPVPFNNGIFVDIGTNCESVVVHYLPIQP